jgi:ppGpp synthetase/RelA/SpoT-type nucleotidyltranferase
VKPAVDRELRAIIDEVGAQADGPVQLNSRQKSAAGLIDKVNRMVNGRTGGAGRPDYQVGDVIDAVGARITVPDMESLERVYAAVIAHFGVRDKGRIVEIDNMYADPKAKNPVYRVIPMVITIKVGGRPYAFELQLTTLRASVAADIEHNSLYKDYIGASPAERLAVGNAFAEAAALDQLEKQHE